MTDAEELLRASLMKVPSGLAEHTMRVVDEAVRLAEIHNVSKDSARLAALGHDLMRAHSNDRLLAIASEQNYPADDVDRMEPILMHGPLAVAVLREQYKVLDADVLGAVAWHTTARAGMSLLQKLLFVADKIEPHKRAGSGAAERVAALADTDLDAALLFYLNHHIDVAIESAWPLHPNTIAARNELIAQRRAGGGK